MGRGCTRTLERVEAITGAISQAETEFEDLSDVENGGVLFALPSLLSNGLLKHIPNLFKLPPGFYGLVHVFLLLGFMALARVKTMERLRYVSPGEWGKLLGLDRIPEVRTLREKVGCLCNDEAKIGEWSSSLAQDWMATEPEAAGLLYVDGHVRVYHGSKTKLPKRYVARQKLALRGVTDYWVNDKIGRPFFRVSSPFSHGLLAMLENEIVPRLIKEVPNQPGNADLERNEDFYRFVLIFDREGYSPDFFLRMVKQRIACQTYRKYPSEKWPEKEFHRCEVKMHYGEHVEMELAERGCWLGGKLWVREIRKKGKNGHQTSVLSTDFRSLQTEIASHMFSRWTQENFFKYMMEHFNLDALAGYELASVDETSTVVNPLYRNIEGRIKSTAAKLVRRKAIFQDMQLLEKNLAPKEVEKFELKKGGLYEEIEVMENELSALKLERKQTKKHIPYSELPEDDKFQQIAPARKQLLDTVKMIAYRAETSMSFLLRDCLGRKDDARPLLREIYNTSAEIIPDKENKLLTVKLHHLANQQSDNAIRMLCNDLNDSETIYPGTEYRMIFDMVSN